MKTIKELKVKLDRRKIKDDYQMYKYWPTIDISDACLLDENYFKKILAEVDLSSFENIDALKMIKKELQKDENKVLMQSNIDLYNIIKILLTKYW